MTKILHWGQVHSEEYPTAPLTKKELIRRLEGRTVTTADGEEHVVDGGAFTAKSGSYVKLATLHTSILRAFLEQNR